MIREILVIIEPVHLVVHWCCVLAGFCSTQHQGAYTDPAHQPLLAIFYEEKKWLKCQRMGMAQHQIKTKLHIESFVRPVSGQTRKALLEERVCGQHGHITSTKHFWHFCSILSLKWACESKTKEPQLPRLRKTTSFSFL